MSILYKYIILQLSKRNLNGALCEQFKAFVTPWFVSMYLCECEHTHVGSGGEAWRPQQACGGQRTACGRAGSLLPLFRSRVNPGCQTCSKHLYLLSHLSARRVVFYHLFSERQLFVSYVESMASNISLCLTSIQHPPASRQCSTHTFCKRAAVPFAAC